MGLNEDATGELRLAVCDVIASQREARLAKESAEHGGADVSSESAGGTAGEDEANASAPWQYTSSESVNWLLDKIDNLPWWAQGVFVAVFLLLCSTYFYQLERSSVADKERELRKQEAREQVRCTAARPCRRRRRTPTPPRPHARARTHTRLHEVVCFVDKLLQLQSLPNHSLVCATHTHTHACMQEERRRAEAAEQRRLERQLKKAELRRKAEAADEERRTRRLRDTAKTSGKPSHRRGNSYNGLKTVDELSELPHGGGSGSGGAAPLGNPVAGSDGVIGGRGASVRRQGSGSLRGAVNGHHHHQQHRSRSRSDLASLSPRSPSNDSRIQATSKCAELISSSAILDSVCR